MTRVPLAGAGKLPAPSAYFLQTPRVGFRWWTEEDLPLALALWADPDVTRLIADLGRPSPEQGRWRLERELGNGRAYGVQYWPIFRLDDEGFLGCCGLRPYRPKDGVYEVGAHLFPRHWGCGYATEALGAVVSHAFGTLQFRGLFARHNPDNHGSRRLLARLGFSYTHDDFLPQTGLNHPSYLLGAEEFRGEAPGPNAPKPPSVVIRSEEPTSPEVLPLIERLDAYQRELYPPESLHLTPPTSLGNPSVTFLAARVDGAVAGCGALLDRGEYGELKRMFVLPTRRGSGIGRRILQMLEARARCLGLRLARLETGVSQPEALRLYEQAGYRRCGPYGEYRADGLTVFMEKELATDDLPSS